MKWSSVLKLWYKESYAFFVRRYFIKILKLEFAKLKELFIRINQRRTFWKGHNFCFKKPVNTIVTAGLEKNSRAVFRDKKIFLESKGWRSGESARLPPMWPGFKSQRRRHLWVEFVVGSLLCSERFFSGYSGFLLSSKTSISKFQFDQESGRRRTTFVDVLPPNHYLCIYLLFYFILLGK